MSFSVARVVIFGSNVVCVNRKSRDAESRTAWMSAPSSPVGVSPPHCASMTASAASWRPRAERIQASMPSAVLDGGHRIDEEVGERREVRVAQRTPVGTKRIGLALGSEHLDLDGRALAALRSGGRVVVPADDPKRDFIARAPSPSSRGVRLI
jgi:hypothetical protein